MQECIFCKIINGDIPATKVYEDESLIAFMDINPANPGHLLIVPKKHYRNLFDIDEETAAHVMTVAVRIARAVKQTLNPDGINLFQASEKAAFQTVFHFHLHVIPRWENDDLVEPWKPEPGDIDAIGKVAEQIKECLLT